MASRSSSAWRAHVGAFAWPTLLLAGGVLLGEGVLWAALVAGVLPLWVGAIIATGLAYVAFTPMHDASHGAISGGRRWAWVDTAVGHTMAALFLAPFAVFRTLHLRHHGATNHPERDPDHWVAANGSGLVHGVSVALRCATILPWYYRTLLVGAWGGDRAFRRALPGGIAALGAMAAVAAALVALGLGTELVALWLLPGLVASGMLAFAFDWLPHHPHGIQKRYQDTRAIDIPGLGLLLLGQNFHNIHHLYPKVPFYRYATLFRELEPELEAKGTPIVRWGRWPHQETARA